MSVKETTGLLDGKQAILDYLNISKHKVMKLIAAGMPVRMEDGRWIAHRENIEGWLKRYTDKSCGS